MSHYSLVALAEILSSLNEADTKAKILSQYSQSHNMTLDYDCMLLYCSLAV